MYCCTDTWYAWKLYTRVSKRAQHRRPCFCEAREPLEDSWLWFFFHNLDAFSQNYAEITRDRGNRSTERRLISNFEAKSLPGMFFHLETFQRWVRNSLLTTVCKFGVALRPYLAIFVLLYSNQGQRRLCANDDDVRLVPGIDITLRLIHPPIRYDISRMLSHSWFFGYYQGTRYTISCDILYHTPSIV